ncbi:MAG: IPTL-CTERM sorting domain-containing protein [Candidatus Dadabacteria bacterium]|nr:IPTL-CTERM sorting domain-containing protein [Candidatus Dadabacteria bacterium]
MRESFQPRPPSVTYSLVGPQGTNITNDNPSASQEWERFSITTGPLDPMVDDLSVAMLEPGLWLIKVFGLDQSNLNVIRFPFAINGVDENNDPVPFDPPEDIRPIPTLSEWGLLTFVLFTLFISVYFIRRNRKLGADIK